MTKFLYPEQYCEYLFHKMKVIFKYNHYEGWLKRGKQDIFVCSGDTEAEVLKEAVDVIREMVDVNTVYEVIVSSLRLEILLRVIKCQMANTVLQTRIVLEKLLKRMNLGLLC